MSKPRTRTEGPSPFEPPKHLTDPNAAKPPESAAPPAPGPDPEPKAALEQRVQAAVNAPDAILLDRDFGFSVHGVLRTWAAGQLITRRADILELLAHDAPARHFREIRNE